MTPSPTLPAPSPSPTSEPAICEEPASQEPSDDSAEPLLQEQGQRLEFKLCDGNLVTLTLNVGTFTQARAVEIDELPLLPPDAETKFGFYAFRIEGLEPGATAAVTLTLPEGASSNAYVKCIDGACNYFDRATFSGNVVTLTLVDGGAGDSDGIANGIILDPGAPVVRVDPALPPMDEGSTRPGGGSLGSSLLFLLIPLTSIALWLRRRWYV